MNAKRYAKEIIISPVVIFGLVNITVAFPFL
jgi:hypothetical protein